ncbi:MAG: hypothetical protein WBA74_02990 [Cyclobacteriaceae bacterium]
MALRVASSGWGAFRIGGDISVYKKEDDDWGSALEKVIWQDSPTVDSYVKLADNNEEYVFHQASFEHVKTFKVYTKLLKLEADKYKKPDSKLLKPIKEIGKTWESSIGSNLFCNMPMVLVEDSVNSSRNLITN